MELIPPALTSDREEIRRALGVLLEPGQVTELRALGVSTNGYKRAHTESGYFADIDVLAEAAAAIPTAHGIYFTINPVNPALLARASNRSRAVEREPLTSDNDITARRWFLVDLDAKRPAGISSTDEEHDAALTRAKEVGKWLQAEGWPKPILGDSGNGAHLLYRIDLPNNDTSRVLVERSLKALGFRFGDGVVEVDETTFNASRIWKLYGTLAAKGDHTPERPHRLSKLLYIPAPLEPVPLELLQALAATLPAAPEPARKTPSGTYTGEAFDLERWIAEHNLDVSGPHAWQGGRKWIFRECPWNSDHRNRSAFIVELPGGAIAAGCQHNSCAGQDWHSLRDLVEPGWRDRPGTIGGPSGKTRENLGPAPGSGAEVTDPIPEARARVDAVIGTANAEEVWGLVDDLATLPLSEYGMRKQKLKARLPEVDWADFDASVKETKEKREREEARRERRAELTDEPAHIDALADFAGWVNKKLGQRSGRETKRQVADRLCDWLLERDRLLYDPKAKKGYLLTDAGAVVSLASEGLELWAELARAGFNPSEPAFHWLRTGLHTTAYNSGLTVKLCHGATTTDDGTICVSCGPTAYVQAQPGEPFAVRRNGDAGILFAATTAFPEWDPEADLVSPLTVRAFTPNLTAPAEVPGYTPDVQKRLLLTWLAGLTVNLRPLPLLALLGGKGGGKSTLCRAVVQMFYGRDENVAALTSDERDFWTLATNSSLYALDNVDAQPPTWFPDAVAAAVTGTRRKVRQLHTTEEFIGREAIAALLISSRTATYCRPDVAERVIPLFVDDLSDDKRVADSDLTAEVAACRDGLLVYLLTKAGQTLNRKAHAPAGLPARFLDYAKWVWAWYNALGDEPLVIGALAAWRQAQTLSVGDADPLLAALLEYGDALPEPEKFRQSASALLHALVKAGAELPYLGGGKAIAARLRELRSSLALAGWTLAVDKDDAGHTFFTLRRK